LTDSFWLRFAKKRRNQDVTLT